MKNISFEEILELCTTSKRPLTDRKIESVICQQEDASLRSPGVHAHYYRFLFYLCQKIEPSLVVELGTHKGFSAACFGAGFPGGKVHAVDINDIVIQECKIPNVEYHFQDSLEVLPVENIDILFIDSAHDGIRPRKEYDLYLPRMAEKSLIFFDDVSMDDVMKKFWSSFNPEFPKYEIPVHGWAGFGLVMVDKTKKG